MEQLGGALAAVGRRIRSICAAAAEAGASTLHTPSGGRLRSRAQPYKSTAARRSLGRPIMAAAPAGPPPQQAKRFHALLVVEQERVADPEASWADIFSRAARRTAEFNHPSKGYTAKYVRTLYYAAKKDGIKAVAAPRRPGSVLQSLACLPRLAAADGEQGAACGSGGR